MPTTVLKTTDTTSTVRRTTALARTGLLCLSLGLGALALSACGSHSASSTPTTAPTSAASRASTVSAPAIVATTATSPSPSAVAQQRRAAAEAAWKEGSVASSAELNRYLQEAVVDLSAARALGVDNTGAYATAIGMLRQLEAVPETDATAAQRATVRSDTLALDTFFGTPGLYGFPAS